MQNFSIFINRQVSWSIDKWIVINDLFIKKKKIDFV